MKDALFCLLVVAFSIVMIAFMLLPYRISGIIYSPFIWNCNTVEMEQYIIQSFTCSTIVYSLYK